MSRTIDPNVPYLIDGKPVAGGYVYYGVANQDPKVNPIPIFSDSTLTVPISNPQRTNSQGIVANKVYVDGDAHAEYSYLVEDIDFNQIVFEPLLNPLGYVPPVTENIDMNGFTFENVEDATANDQFATLGQNNLAYPITVVTDIASLPDAISVTLPVPLLSLIDGQQIIVQLRHGANTNVTPLTLKVEPFAPRQVYRDNNETVNVGDTIGLDHFAHFAYNSTLNKWELTNPSIQGIISNDIDMDGYKHYNVADADDNQQYGSHAQNNKLYPQVVQTDGASTPDVIVANIPVAPSSLVDGQQVIVKVLHGQNTIPTPTLNLNSFGNKLIYREVDQVLMVGDTAGGGYFCHLVYNADLDKFQLINPENVNNRNLQDDTIDGSRLEDNSVTNTQIATDTITGNRVTDSFMQKVLDDLPAPVAGENYIWKALHGSTYTDSPASEFSYAITARKTGTVTLLCRAEERLQFSLYKIAPRSCPGNIQIFEPGSGDSTWQMFQGDTYTLDIVGNTVYYFMNFHGDFSGDAIDEASLEIRTGNNTVFSPVDR
jgi:hypothetical protein